MSMNRTLPAVASTWLVKEACDCGKKVDTKAGWRRGSGGHPTSCWAREISQHVSPARQAPTECLETRMKHQASPDSGEASRENAGHLGWGGRSLAQPPGSNRGST